MKRKRTIVSLSILFCILCISWQFKPISFREVPNDTFRTGEFLKFRMHYGIINAGYMELEVDPRTYVINGRECMHITGRGYSNKGWDRIYRVRDTYESYMDKRSMFSWRFQRDIQEGKFKAYTETHFDQTNRSASYVDRHGDTLLFDINANMQDVISAYYYARTVYDQKKLKPGDRINLENFIDRKTVKLEAELVKREVIKVHGTKYKTLKLRLTIAESGLITDGSKIFLWVSDDDNKVPIRMASHLLIGSLKADLYEYKNLKHPFTARLGD